MYKKRQNKLYVVVVFLALFFFLAYFFSSEISLEETVSFVNSFGYLAPIVYILFFTLSHILAPLSGTVFYFAGFILFGKNALILTYIATLISSALNFWIAKKWGRGIVVKLIGSKSMLKVDRLTDTYGIGMLIVLRGLQAHITEFVSFAYGLTKISFKVYYVISSLAPIPYYLVSWYLIDDLRSFTGFYFGSLLVLSLISLLIAFNYKSRSFKNNIKI